MLQENDNLELQEWIVDLRNVIQCAERYQNVGKAGNDRACWNKARPLFESQGATMGYGYSRMLDVEAHSRNVIELNCNAAGSPMVFPKFFAALAAQSITR